MTDSILQTVPPVWITHSCVDAPSHNALHGETGMRWAQAMTHWGWWDKGLYLHGATFDAKREATLQARARTLLWGEMAYLDDYENRDSHEWHCRPSWGFGGGFGRCRRRDHSAPSGFLQ